MRAAIVAGVPLIVISVIASPAHAQVVRSSFGVVYFELDSYEIDAVGERLVDEAADWLAVHPDGRLVVEGHASRGGPRDYNLWLSRQRAEAVRDALAARGVPEQRIAIVASGETEPISEVPAENRRVRIWATTL